MTTPQSTYVLAERAEIAPFLPAEARSFLDVGCARGGFGLTIRRLLGPEVRLVGIEPVEVQAQQARRHYDSVLTGLYPEALAGSSERFDCVVLNDVLEHMLDPWGALAGMHDLLTRDGRIVASVPNIQFLPVWWQVLRGRWDYTDSGTLDRTHLRFFTRATMVEMFEDAGYEVEHVQGLRYLTGGRKAFLLRPFRRLLGNSAWLQFVIVAKPCHRPSPARSTPTDEVLDRPDE